ncbi:four helix bundle protein [Pendulispora brunnea]|uniref:Four helix bundle protein n=1 Tax=Pendulispora brunnea TaxID=2905690 RepID=A0ABZ2JZP8_9BACT
MVERESAAGQFLFISRKDMQTNPFQDDPGSRVLELAIHAIVALRPTFERIRCCDRELADQFRTALRIMAMKAAEGNRSQGGSRMARFRTAASSNSESRAALRVAVAWGYLSSSEVEADDELLERIGGMLRRLAAGR